MEDIILNCIKKVLINEGYTYEQAVTAISWNFPELLPLIEQAKNLVKKEG